MFENRLGTVRISQKFFSKLIGNAVSSCYGVTKMAREGVSGGVKS